MRKETLRNIKLTAAGLGALVGISSGAFGLVDSHNNNSAEKIKSGVQQIIPDYQPEKILAAQGVIADFNNSTQKSIAEGIKLIEVPENVIQAAIFIKNNQTAYDQGSKLFESRKNNQFTKDFLLTSGGLSLATVSSFKLAEYLKKKYRFKIVVPGLPKKPIH